MLSRVWAARGVLNVARAAHIPRSRPLFNPSVSQRSIAYKVPMRDVRFLLHELNDTKKHYAGLKNSGGEDASPEMVESILDEFSKFAEEVLVPINEGGDQVGCKQIGPNEVKTPPGFKEAYDQFVEGGWQGMSFPQKWGGLGLPASLQLFTSEMTATACWTWTMFPGLSKGAINTLLAHGDDFVQGKYLPQLVSGEWSGTMCLTEPQCGSDLAQVATKAVPIEGTNKYKISGTKIFISCGEHDLTSNIIHCVRKFLPEDHLVQYQKRTFILCVKLRGFGGTPVFLLRSSLWRENLFTFIARFICVWNLTFIPPGAGSLTRCTQGHQGYLPLCCPQVQG